MPEPTLSAAAAAGIADLELAARLVVEGVRAGAHRSPFHGYSAEFRQHRPYRAGDDLKHLDWKMLARTDRLYTRQYRETTNLSAMIALDASASMAFPDGAGEVSKFRYASVLAAALAYVVITQGDSAGLIVAGGRETSYLPARGGRAHLSRLTASIQAARPAGSWNAPGVIEQAAERLGRRGVVLVISDLYDDEAHTRAALRRARGGGQDLAVLHVLSRAELEFPFDGVAEFEDAETGERRVADARAVAGRYREELRAFLDDWRTAAQRDGMDYVLASTAEPPADVLRRYLLARRAAAPTGGATVMGR